MLPEAKKGDRRRPRPPPGAWRRATPASWPRLCSRAQAAVGGTVQLRAAPDQEGGLLDRAAGGVASLFQPSAKAPNRTGLPERLKAGVESQSGLAMDDVRVHRNSPEPAQARRARLYPGQRHPSRPRPGAASAARGLARRPAEAGPGEADAADEGSWALCDDAGLEAEADRMSPTIESGSGAAIGPNILRPPNSPAVVQRAIMHKGVWLTKYLDDAASPYSKTVQYYNNLAKKFVLRDLCVTTATPAHLLEEGKRYLLGQNHGDQARWVADTSAWSVSKLLEGCVHFAADQPIPESTAFAGTSKDFRGENAFPFTLQGLLYANTYLNPVTEKKMVKHWAVVPWQYMELCGVVKALIKLSKDYQTHVKGNPAVVSAEQQLTLQFSQAYTTSYVGKLSKLDNNLVTLGITTKGHNIEAIGRASEAVRTNSEFISEMIETLKKIIGISDDTREGKQVAAAVGRSSTNSRAAFKSLNPRRDEDIAAHAKGAPTPLLVSLGDSHVKGVAKHLSGSAVKVRYADKFEDYTAHTKR